MSDDLLDKEREADGKIDVPAPSPRRKAPGEPKSIPDFVEWLIKTVGTATIGHQILDRYAISFKLKDGNWFLFRVFLVLAYLLDLILGIILLSVIVTLIVGLAYVLLRGLDAADQTVEIIKAITDYVKEII